MLNWVMSSDAALRAASIGIVRSLLASTANAIGWSPFIINISRLFNCMMFVRCRRYENDQRLRGGLTGDGEPFGRAVFIGLFAKTGDIRIKCLGLFRGGSAGKYWDFRRSISVTAANPG